eukprot:TRINITY_DN5341_c0_g1_i1.p1 TRINITY_DN5341_c0_g1~~TRINITY_DN5341_c0_g1_i1.p1  ORF type:complete len:219 (-),score=19.23 TRINITY_DN5341_c0_g1_i1:59-715(-)
MMISSIKSTSLLLRPSKIATSCAPIRHRRMFASFPAAPAFEDIDRKKELIESIIRVDHAGEFGAQRIYEGQMAVLKNTPVGPIIQEMMDQETIHLQTFEKLMQDRRVRPTALFPFWDKVGYAAGYASALLGKESAMALTVAVEEVIGEHYNAQLRALNDAGHFQDSELRDSIRKFRDDELHHLETGLKHDAERAFMYEPLKEAAKAGTRLAIWLSTRI